MARTFAVAVAVLSLVVAAVFSLASFRGEVPRPGDIGLASVLGTLVEIDDRWATLETADGTMRRVDSRRLYDTAYTVYAPRPGIGPEPGDLVLTASIHAEVYYLIAGSTGRCKHAVKFDFAFDEPDAIIGAALSGLGGRRTGFRLPKSGTFDAVDSPDYAGIWYDYYVEFCVNEAGEVVDAKLFSHVPRLMARYRPDRSEARDDLHSTRPMSISFGDIAADTKSAPLGSTVQLAGVRTSRAAASRRKGISRR